MHSRDLAVLETLGGVAAKHGKAYCYPSQMTIVGLLRRYHGVEISRRTINRVLEGLEGAGFFKRIRRHHKGASGEIVFRTTLYKLAGKFFKFFGYLSRWPRRFAESFRVPNLAQHLPSGEQGSSLRGSIPVDKLAKGEKEGAPSAASSGNPPPSQLERVRNLVNQVLKRGI